MRKVRFSIRGLLILVTAIVLFLGFSQYRRREILKVAAQLKDEGYVFEVPDSWHDRIFQRKPTVARIIKGGLVFQMHMGSLVGTIRTEDPDEEEVNRLKSVGMLREN
jgi:hypothetical protein